MVNAYPESTAPTNPATRIRITARMRTSAMTPMSEGIEAMGPAIKNANAAPRSMPKSSRPLSSGMAALPLRYAGKPTAAAMGIDKGLLAPRTVSIQAAGR